MMAAGVSIPPIQIEYGTQRKDDADILMKELRNVGIKKRDIVTKPNRNELLLFLTVGPRRTDL
jgi:hypothetical protein